MGTIRIRIRMNNPDHISQNSETFFGVKILKFFVADQAEEKFGYGRNIRYPQH
jgi:hypothetical protein